MSVALNGNELTFTELRRRIGTLSSVGPAGFLPSLIPLAVGSRLFKAKWARPTP